MSRNFKHLEYNRVAPPKHIKSYPVEVKPSEGKGNGVFATLIYPGCGYDEELTGLGLPYDRIIAYDTLPKWHHYKPGQPGWVHTATADHFFAKLRREYGEFEAVSDTELYFPKHNMTYHHSTNCHHVKEIPAGDIYVRGYLCESWLAVMRQRRVLASCDTWLEGLDGIEFEIVHTCKGEHCCMEDGAYSSDSDT